MLTTWFDVPISEEANDIVTLIAGVLLALGILTDTGQEPKPITTQSVLEKLKSPVGVGAIFALVSYILYRQMGAQDADTVLKILDSLIVGLFGFSVYNNPNSRESIR